MSESLSSGARVARGATYMFVQGFAASLIGVFYIIVVTRTLSDTERGVYAIFNLILSGAQVFGTFALSSASVKYIAQHKAEGEPEKAKSLVSRVLQISLISCTIAFVTIAILEAFLSSSLFGDLTQASVFYLLAVASVLNLLYVQVIAFVQGSQRILELAIVGSVYTVFQNVIGVSLLFMGFGLWGIVLGWIAGLLPSVLLGLTFTRKFVGFSRKFYPMRPLVRFCLPLYLSGILSYFVGWIDQVIVLLFISTEALGMYYIAVRASVVPSLVAASIVAALFPKLSELYAKGGNRSLKDAFRASTRYASLIGFPIIIGLAVLAKPVMILFAWELEPAAWPLSILCVAMLPSTLGLAIAPTLVTQERIKAASLLAIVTVVSEAVVSLVLFGPLGIDGAAWSRVVASFLTFLLGVLALRKSLGIPFDKEALWKSFASSVLMVLGIASMDVLRQYIETGALLFDQILRVSLRFLPIYVIVGALVYFASMIVLKAIKKHDLDLLRAYLPSGFKRIVTWLSRVARVK